MPRPPKYRTDEERRLAKATSSAGYREKQRQQKSRTSQTRPGGSQASQSQDPVLGQWQLQAAPPTSQSTSRFTPASQPSLWSQVTQSTAPTSQGTDSGRKGFQVRFTHYQPVPPTAVSYVTDPTVGLAVDATLPALPRTLPPIVIEEEGEKTRESWAPYETATPPLIPAITPLSPIAPAPLHFRNVDLLKEHYYRTINRESPSEGSRRAHENENGEGASLPRPLPQLSAGGGEEFEPLFTSRKGKEKAVYPARRSETNSTSGRGADTVAGSPLSSLSERLMDEVSAIESLHESIQSSINVLGEAEISSNLTTSAAADMELPPLLLSPLPLAPRPITSFFLPVPIAVISSSSNALNEATKTASLIPSLPSTSSPSSLALPPRVISPQRAAPAASSLRFEEDIVTRSPAGSPHTTRIQAGTNELPPPLPVYAFLIKALKGVPACSSARHLDQQAVNTHSHLHRDERTSVSCHCLGDVTLAMEGRPLPASPAVPPASAGYHESLRRAIRQLRLGDDGGEPAGGAATPVPLDQVPVSLPSGPPLPKVLDSGRLGMRAYPENLHCQQAFEGSGTGGVPPRLCMPQFYDQTSQNARPFQVSYDIDSICGFSSSLAVAKQGVRWFPAMNPKFNIKSNIHLGIPVPPPVTEANGDWQPMPLHLVPHYAFGQICGWDSMVLYLVFPRLFRHGARGPPSGPNANPLDGVDRDEADHNGVNQPHVAEDGEVPAAGEEEDAGPFARRRTRGKGLESLLSSDQISLWVDGVLLPSIYLAVAVAEAEAEGGVGNVDSMAARPDANILQHLPQSYRAAVNMAHAPKESLATARQGDAKSQNVGFLLGHRYLAVLTDILRQTVAGNPEFAGFGDFQLFFNTKNTKIEFMRSAMGGRGQVFQETIDDFTTQWRRHFNDTYYDRDSVWVDIGKQITSADTTLPYTERLPPGFEAQTFLWRTCCLETIVQARKDWLRACRLDAQQLATAEEAEGGGSSGAAARQRRPQQQQQQRRRHGFASPAVAWYPWAMVDGVSNVTMTSAAGGYESKEGLVYTQLYSLIKGPFDAQKHFALQPPVYENMAIDPLYLRQLRQDGRATIINQTAAKEGYVRGKNRAALNLREVPNRSFGLRAEDRITLALLDEVRRYWDEVEVDVDVHELQATVESRSETATHEAAATAAATTHAAHAADSGSAFPWFAIPTAEVAQFLAAQINRHCLLFEYVLSQTDLMFSLEETVPMVIALRGLRYCYNANLLYKEPLLFRDNWRQYEWAPAAQGASIVVHPRRKRPRTTAALTDPAAGGSGTGSSAGSTAVVERLGLGMHRSMQRHGFGWWRPDVFRWQYWRFKPEVCTRLLVGNILLHEEYRRRWRAVRQIRDSTIQLFQARQWYTQFDLAAAPAAGGRRQRWLDYLHCLVLRQFDLDVWERLHQESRNYPELCDAAAAQHPPSNPPEFCYTAMKDLFFDRGGGYGGAPHLIAGNRTGAEKTPMLVIEHLFEWRDGRKRAGWSATKYRVLAQRAHQAVMQCISEERADQWFKDLCRLVLLTRWILPYPSATAFFSTTKAVAHNQQYRRTMWVSTMLCQWEGGLAAIRQEGITVKNRDIDGLLVAEVSDQRAIGQGTIRHHKFRGKALFPLLYKQETLSAAIGERHGCQVAELLESTKDIGETHEFAIGRIPTRDGGRGRFIPVVEIKQPPSLAFGKVMVGKSLDEMDTWFNEN